MDSIHIRKRPRPVVSCLRCREKKLKCDRVVPCENCTKAGCPGDCMYSQTGSVDLPKSKRILLDQNTDPPNDLGRAGLGIIEDLQQRMVKLEEMLSVRPGSVRDSSVFDPGSTQSTNIVPSASTPPFVGTLVVKGSRTRYHGQNNRISLLNQFSEAKEFIETCIKDSSLVGLAKEVQFLQRKSQQPLNSPESVSDFESSPEILQMRASLPPKPACDRLIRIYTTNFEKVLRIIHVPTFLRQYTQFWSDPDNDSYQSSAFIPQLTAILAISLVLEDQTFQTDYPSSWEYLKQTAVGLVRLWLKKLGRKQQTELVTLQVETLLLQVRRLRQLSAEELWRSTGSLVRAAMVMGLHLNLSESTELSVFHLECRRRLWVTIVEMDLQASIASGMPIMTPDLDYGSLSPSNLNDMDFDESTIELPLSRPLNEWTDSLPQIALAMSLTQRIRAMSLVKSSTSRVDLSELVRHGRKIEECLRMIPTVLRLDSKVGNSPAFLLNRVILDVYIRRPLLCLYRPIVMGDGRDDIASQEIQRVCLESSLAVLSYQDYFDPNVADLDMSNPLVYWDIFQIYCKNDILWAALSVCGYIKLSSQQPSTPQIQGAMHNMATLTRAVENTLESLTRRIDKTGSNIKDVLLLAVVLQSVRSRGSNQIKERMHQGAHEALSACRQHLLPAVTDQPFPFNLADFANIPQLNQPTPQQLQLPGFFAQSSALANEFNNFQGDPFSFEDGSFAWNF